MDLATLRESARMIRDQMRTAIGSESGARRADARTFIATVMRNAYERKGINPPNEAEIYDKLDSLGQGTQESQEMFITGLEQVLSELK